MSTRSQVYKNKGSGEGKKNPSFLMKLKDLENQLADLKSQKPKNKAKQKKAISDLTKKIDAIKEFISDDSNTTDESDSDAKSDTSGKSLILEEKYIVFTNCFVLFSFSSPVHNSQQFGGQWCVVGF